VCSVPIFKPHWPKYATNYASTSSLKAVAVCRDENNILQSRINRAQKCGGEAIGRAGAATLGGYELRSNFSV